jgi:hypothetical protein
MSTISEAEYRERIAALERQCATLAAQVDRMTRVIDVARVVVDRSGAANYGELVIAVTLYNAQMAQLAKEG